MDPRGERVVVRVLSQVPDGVGATDRVRLSQEVVAEADPAVRIGATELGQGGAGAGADLVREIPSRSLHVALVR